MIVATAGHVDHGKTTLIRALTGTDTDKLPEEKARGMSINLGFAYRHFPSSLSSSLSSVMPRRNTISFVDVPGHADFTGNMLAGAWSADVAMIVVAADEGIMPQTREHVLLLHLLGISRGVVVITAVDRASTARVDEVGAAMQALLASTSLQGVPIFPVSALTGAGIVALSQHLETLTLDTSRPDPSAGYLRFAIDRSFTLKGIGTVVTGTVCAGSVGKNDQLLHSGTGEVCRVRSLHLDDMALESASPGQRIALGISLHHGELRRGDWLMTPELHHPIEQFDVRLRFAQHLNGASPAVPNADIPLHLHLGAAHHIVKLKILELHDADALQEVVGWGQIRSREPMIAHWGDRFILRDATARATIAGGTVMDIFARRRKADSHNRITTLRALDHDHEKALRALLTVAHHGVSMAEFAINRNLSPMHMQVLHQRLVAQGTEFEALPVRSTSTLGHTPTVLLGSAFHQTYRDKVLQTLAQWHASNPDKLGLAEAALLQRCEFNGPSLLFNALLRSFVDQAQIVRTGTLLHLPDHKAMPNDAETLFMERLHPLLLQGAYVAPRVFELMEMLNMSQSALEHLLQMSCRAGKLLQVSRNRFYLPETLLAIATFTEMLASEHPDTGFSVIQFRTSSGIGRNLSIELLEYFDAQGFTRRQNNARVLRCDKESIFGVSSSA